MVGDLARQALYNHIANLKPLEERAYREAQPWSRGLRARQKRQIKSCLGNS